ncbi:c-type cytochrome [Halovulum sp. GXIMD14793]
MKLSRAILAAALMAAPALPSHGQEVVLLSGHGGPVKGIAVEDQAVLTASFDYALGLWQLDQPDAPVWLDGHTAAVNAAVFLPNGRAASAGDDFSIIVWDLNTRESVAEMTGHNSKILDLAVSLDGQTLATASWDGRIGVWSVPETRLLRWIEVGSNVNDVQFSDDGQTIYSATFDGTVRSWDVTSGDQTGLYARHGFGINRLVLNEAAGWLAYGALDGGTRAIRLSDNAQLADLTLDRRPILSLALNPDGTRLAVGDGEGFIMTVDTTDWSIAHDFKAALRGPIWALAFSADGTRLLAGGIDDAAFVWPAEHSSDQQMATDRRSFLRDPSTMENGERQFMRKCSICHSLTPDTARKAGPSLYSIFGRQAGTLPGYPYSEAMRQTDIVWTDETISKLFELGPDNYTPGSKMPMQVIVAESDRADLLAFLKRTTTDQKEKGD